MHDKDEIQKKIASMKSTLSAAFEGENKKKIDDAIEYIEGLTEGQKRKNGEPLIIHPFSVAYQTMRMELGPHSVCAALLHDAIEDNIFNDEIPKHIEEKFGQDVLDLVLSLTNFRTPTINPVKMNDTEVMQKYLIATSKDLRVIMIKIADKLHNLATVEGLPPTRQEVLKSQVEKIYVPIAEYLGLHKFMKEMRDTLLQKNNPETYQKIKTFIEKNRPIDENVSKKIIDELITICDIEGLLPQIYGRVKSITSIYEKMKRLAHDGKTSSLEYIRDVLGIRIITSTTEECYKVLDLVNKFYDVEEDSLDDYIAKPKKNGYKSIHLIPIHPKYGPFELQLRTCEMHYFDEFGPASHIAYKKAGTSNAQACSKYNWVADINFKELDYDMNNDKPIHIKLFDNLIFAITPKSDIVELAKDSTPVDFAYELHSELGDRTIAARVNGRSRPLNTKLKTGDVVEIISDPKKRYASEEWLKFVKTEKAEAKIRRSINRKAYAL